MSDLACAPSLPWRFRPTILVEESRSLALSGTFCAVCHSLQTASCNTTHGSSSKLQCVSSHALSAFHMPPLAKSAAPAAPSSVPEQRPPPRLTPKAAFSIFFVANVIAAVFSPVQDCDEVFNYWEPTHYLNHGHGLQTWEYSPQYAIRSWAYTGMHAIVIEFGRLLPFMSNKTSQFYFLRIVLGLFCASCETKLFSTISKTLNPRVAIFFLMAMVSSPGMYHASIAYLPSSFAMYTTMLGFSAFMNWAGGMRTAQGVFWFAVGSLLGWPFAGALVLPFVFEELFLAVTTGEIVACIKRLLDGTNRSLFVLVSA
jgi:alpha-1,2-mannosyltransferase